jgi:hypothetical protein
MSDDTKIFTCSMEDGKGFLKLFEEEMNCYPTEILNLEMYLKFFKVIHENPDEDKISVIITLDNLNKFFNEITEEFKKEKTLLDIFSKNPVVKFLNLDRITMKNNTNSNDLYQASSSSNQKSSSSNQISSNHDYTYCDVVKTNITSFPPLSTITQKYETKKSSPSKKINLKKFNPNNYSCAGYHKTCKNKVEVALYPSNNPKQYIYTCTMCGIHFQEIFKCVDCTHEFDI